MSTYSSVKGYEQSYDEMVENSGYRVPEALFGLMYELIKPGKSLLDIGVGTGRVARLFAKAGLELHGMDKSPKMLELCSRKVDFISLKQHDLSVLPYPYISEAVDYITCAGVLNHFDDLSVFFAECARVLRVNGYLAFMTGYMDDITKCLERLSTKKSSSCRYNRRFGHSDKEVEQYLNSNSFVLRRSLMTRVNSNMNQEHVQSVKIYVAEKIF